MVLFCGFTAYLGLYFLTRSASLAPHRSASFSSLSKLTFPGLARVFDFAVALKCFGVSISYLIVIGGLMPKVRLSFSFHSSPKLMRRELLSVGREIVQSIYGIDVDLVR